MRSETERRQDPVCPNLGLAMPRAGRPLFIVFRSDSDYTLGRFFSSFVSLLPIAPFPRNARANELRNPMITFQIIFHFLDKVVIDFALAVYDRAAPNANLFAIKEACREFRSRISRRSNVSRTCPERVRLGQGEESISTSASTLLA